MFDEKKGQGATEYLLMLAAVLVIAASAIYFVTTTGGYPAVGVTPAAGADNDIEIQVTTGSIPANEWQFKITVGTDADDPTTSFTDSEGEWVDGENKLNAPSVVIATDASGTYEVGLRHKDTKHVYFAEKTVTVE